MTVRFGQIGYGAWGQCHAQAIASNSEAQLVAIAARSAESCQRAAQDHHGITVDDDYQQLLARDDVDVVVIVVPSYLHRRFAEDALRAGKHVLLEKPMCLNLADCDQLIATAEQQRRLLAVGHELRLSSLWSRVKALIDEGFIGDPQYCLVELSRKPYRLGADGWRYDLQRVGNWILEEPIHFFDLACWYLEARGQPTRVYAAANSKQAGHPELQDNFSAIVHFQQGAYAVVAQTLSAFEHHQMVKVTGTRGALWARWSGAMDRTRHPDFGLRAFDGEQVQDIHIDKITGEIFELEDQVAMMVAAVRGERSLSCTAAEGRRSVALCLAAQQSVDSGTPVPWPR